LRRSSQKGAELEMATRSDRWATIFRRRGAKAIQIAIQI
jgi:hypothetical protein